MVIGFLGGSFFDPSPFTPTPIESTSNLLPLGALQAMVSSAEEHAARADRLKRRLVTKV